MTENKCIISPPPGGYNSEKTATIFFVVLSTNWCYRTSNLQDDDGRSMNKR